MKKTLLFGEPMALLLADTPGALEGVEHFTRRMSGAEVNVAIGLTRLGFPVEYLTRLGDDPFGHYIEQALKDNGIGTNLLTYDPVYRTGIQLKEYVKDGHDPAAPYYRKGSAASHLSIREIDALDLGEIGLVHVTGIPPALSKEAREATYRLMERARKAQIPVTFDPNLRPALWENDEMMRKVLNGRVAYPVHGCAGRILCGTAAGCGSAVSAERVGADCGRAAGLSGRAWLVEFQPL